MCFCIHIHSELLIFSAFSYGILFICFPNKVKYLYANPMQTKIHKNIFFTFFQFLGVWYAIQKTSTASSCVIYNITETNEPGEYHIEQVSQHFALGLIKHDYSYTGVLRTVDKDLPSKMSVKFPLSKYFF